MSETATSRLALAFVPDLFFAAKIAATAEAAGVRLELLGAQALVERSASLEPAARPAVVILDLGAGEPALAIARALAAAAPAVPTVGFYSHVDTATRDAAVAAGVATVLPRSAFVARLPALLKGH